MSWSSCCWDSFVAPVESEVAEDAAVCFRDRVVGFVDDHTVELGWYKFIKAAGGGSAEGGDTSNNESIVSSAAPASHLNANRSGWVPLL